MKVSFFVEFAEDNATIVVSSMWYFENHVWYEYFVQNRRK